jgi:nicotinamide mononucleotide transporter
MLQELITQISANTILDWLAFLFGVAQVVLAWKNEKVNFIAGIISVSLYAYIFFKAGLFAESFLNVYYLAISIYGLALWGKSAIVQKITFCATKDWINAGLIFIFAFVAQWYILQKFTSSTVPMLDSLVSSLAWAGAWLLTKRKVENWVILNVSNLLAIPLFIYKNLYLVAVLYIVFFIIAIFGYIQWKKEAQNF